MFGNTTNYSRVAIAIFTEQKVTITPYSEDTNFSDLYETSFSDLYQKQTLEGREITAALSRTIGDVIKVGIQHTCLYDELIQRAPADGSGQYKCTFIPINVHDIGSVATPKKI